MRDIWNPWHGCKKISEGCQNCYMYHLDKSRGKNGSNIYKVKSNFNYPIKKDIYGKYKIKSGEILRVCMTSDFFLEEADLWRDDAWDIIRKRNDVVFMLITKRADRIEKCLPDDWGDGWDNVWLNITTENQKRADERIPILLNIPAKYKGILAAPLLENLNIDKYLKTGKIDIVSIGGENYSGARECKYDWVKNIYEQCVENNVNCNFFETGNFFIKDNKQYKIPKKLQQIQALRSGLNYKSRKMIFNYISRENDVFQVDLFNDNEHNDKTIDLIDVFMNEEKILYCTKCNYSNCNQCPYEKHK